MHATADVYGWFTSNCHILYVGKTLSALLARNLLQYYSMLIRPGNRRKHLWTRLIIPNSNLIKPGPGHHHCYCQIGESMAIVQFHSQFILFLAVCYSSHFVIMKLSVFFLTTFNVAWADSSAKKWLFCQNKSKLFAWVGLHNLVGDRNTFQISKKYSAVC